MYLVHTIVSLMVFCFILKKLYITVDIIIFIYRSWSWTSVDYSVFPKLQQEISGEIVTGGQICESLMSIFSSLYFFACLTDLRWFG